jgi:hypothetical protein
MEEEKEEEPPETSLEAPQEEAAAEALAPYLLPKAELLCICAIPWISR